MMSGQVVLWSDKVQTAIKKLLLSLMMGTMFQLFKVHAFHGHLMTDQALLGTLHQSLSR